jgi:hypothetical protein
MMIFSEGESGGPHLRRHIAKLKGKGGDQVSAIPEFLPHTFSAKNHNATWRIFPVDG